MTARNVYAEFENFAKNEPDSPAVIHGPQTISFAKLHEMAYKLGTAMRVEGVRPGSTVLIKAGMPLWDYLFCVAALHEGAVAAVQNGATYNEAIGADFAFSAFPIDGFPSEKTIKIDNAWLKQSEQITPLPSAAFESANPLVRLVQTSGTTGAPKVLEYDIDSFVGLADEAMADDVDPLFCLLPFSIFGGAIFGYHALVTGQTYLLPTGKSDQDAKMIAVHGIKNILASTTMVADLYSDDILIGDLAGLNLVRTIGANVPRKLAQRFRSTTNAVLINRLGTTETGRIAGREVSLADDPNLIGEIYPNVEVRVTDSNSNILGSGEIGRVGIRTRNIRSGYRNNPEATAKHFIDGFFYSGDEGYVDEKGLLYLVGREDERINSGGVKTDPSALDANIAEVQGVRDAAVFGFTRNDGIRGLAAVLVLETGANMANVVSKVELALGSKKPSFFIEVDSISRNLMGKVERIKLEAQYGDDIKRMCGK